MAEAGKLPGRPQNVFRKRRLQRPSRGLFGRCCPFMLPALHLACQCPFTMDGGSWRVALVFPTCTGTASRGDYNVMVIDLLGPSLEDHIFVVVIRAIRFVRCAAHVAVSCKCCSFFIYVLYVSLSLLILR